MDPRALTPAEFLTTVTRVLESMGIPYAVTGSMASMFYGEMRTTNDVDVVADLKPEQVREFVARFPADEFYVSEDAARSAISHRQQFNIIHPVSGLKAVIIIARDEPHDRQQLARARSVEPAPGLSARFAAPEDVILKKLWFYQEGGSEKHLRDIASMFKIYGDHLDLPYLDDWAHRLGVADEWRMVLERVKRP